MTQKLLELIGKAHRGTVEDPFTIPDNSWAMAAGRGQAQGIDPATLPGVVVDDRDAATIWFSVKVPATGRYEIRIA